jgi:hypothetical protein
MVYTVPNFVGKKLSDFKSNDQLKVLAPSHDNRFAIIKSYHNSKNVDSWSRSVVWDKTNEIPVSVSPPKSSTEFPFSGWTLLQEHVDGVMINAFRVKDVSGVTIATRSYLGATNRYNGLDYTFADLLNEVISPEELDAVVGPLCDESARFTSLVLVHPKIRQVVPVVERRVYVVHQGSVSADGTVSIEENPENWTTAASTLAPRNLSIPSFNNDSLENFVNTKLDAFQWKWQGMSAKNEQGMRWRYTTESYRKARSLKGNESDNVERFLRLRRSRAVQSYLKYYSEDTDAFWQLEMKLRSVTHEIFSEYCLKNKAKSKALNEVPPAYRVHVYGLHSLFISTLKPKNMTLQKEHVVEYLNTQQIERVAHLLRVGGGTDATKPIPHVVPVVPAAEVAPVEEVTPVAEVADALPV